MKTLVESFKQQQILDQKFQTKKHVFCFSNKKTWGPLGGPFEVYGHIFAQ